MNNYCSNCGHKLRDEDENEWLYCPNCDRMLMLGSIRKKGWNCKCVCGKDLKDYKPLKLRIAEALKII